jgi:diguanylate cyclase (GGDEF)-like protein/PAS domain S-box-containing protein
MNRLVTALMGAAEKESTFRFRLRLLTVISFFAAAALGTIFASLALHVHTLSRQKDAEVTAANQSSALEERLERSLSSTYALAAVLRQGNGRIARFEELAGEMLHIYGGIASLQLAKDGVVSEVAPLKENAKALGHDLLSDPSRNKEALLAVQSHALTLTSPLELLQGGLAVIGRLPVYLPDDSGRDAFWGFTIAVIRIPDLLASSGLPALARDGYRYKLSYAPTAEEPHIAFAQSDAQPMNSPVARTIAIPNGHWYLAIEPAQGWVDPLAPVLAGITVFLLALCTAWVAHTTFKQPLILRRRVEQRTSELAHSNQALSLEIAQRKRAQDEAQHLSQMYSALSRTNGAIVRIGDRDKLLEEICRTAVEHGGFVLARIALKNPDDGRWHWVARCGEDVNLPHCDDMMPNLLDTGSVRGNGNILKICSDINADNVCPLCPAAEAAGFRSHAVLQLRQDDRTVGLFSLYANERDYIDEKQLKLLDEMVSDVSFALDNIEREANRRKTEDKLRKLSLAVEQSASAIMITDRDGIIEYINPWFTRISGYLPEEIIGKTPNILKAPETHPETYKRLWETLLSGKEWTGELHNTNKNGELYWCLETISPLKNDAGEITHYVAVTEDISERKQNEQTIRHLAFHDALTGLPNRRLFNDRLHQAVVSRQRRNGGFALMLLDLDRFKTVNDSLGHDTGDALLKAVGERLLSCTRAGDTLARMGGDEFALLVLDIDHPEDVAHLARKLTSVLEEPFQLYGHEIFATTSIGITMFPTDAGDADALVKNADIALYRAKDLGRDNFQFFTEDMNAAMLQRLQLETSMRWAVERGEFMLHYQPQIDVGSGEIHSCEALIRWRHPDLGMVPPSQFIPLAEESGLISQIGEWILRTACKQAKDWELAGCPTRIAVNLSARQFHQGNLAELIGSLLSEFDLRASLLEVEITEGTVMSDSTQTLSMLDELHAMGVQISIDDFGTGYSSLAYLKRLPIQVLKIDQSFVRDIHTDADDRAIVTAVIALAHSMKLKVVAEGVETREQLAFLSEHGCDIVQGYLFSKPVSAEDASALLQAALRPTA